MTFSLRLSDEDAKLVQHYAEMKKLSVSEVMRAAIFEQIETEFDLLSYEQEMREYQAHPVAYSHDEVKKELGLGNV
jgi:predicted transcriptional regulator